jgi:hypothetical protein
MKRLDLDFESDLKFKQELEKLINQEYEKGFIYHSHVLPDQNRHCGCHSIYFTSRYNKTFGEALELMKEGYKVARKGWAGKGWAGKDMWIALLNMTEHESHKSVSLDDGSKDSYMFKVNPYITMKTVDNKLQHGWVPSQQDMLSEDWSVTGLILKQTKFIDNLE